MQTPYNHYSVTVLCVCVCVCVRMCVSLGIDGSLVATLLLYCKPVHAPHTGVYPSIMWWWIFLVLGVDL